MGDLLKSKLSISATKPELEVCRKLAELIGTRAARLSACGIAAICKKKNWTEAHVGADGSVFQKYPHFKDRNRLALREIFDWPESSKDLIIVQAAEDGSGVGAALIAALTLKRAQEGNHCGIKDPQGLLKTAKAALDGFQA